MAISRLHILAAAALVFIATLSRAQGLHFSQFYNAPMITSPANTGLMSDNDYRLGMNYRSQWASLPSPFRSFSLYGDMQVFRRRNGTNWLGVGGAMFSDKTGDGNLSLNRWEAFAAYHLQLGEYSMISLGGSAATVTRTVDFSKLTFDTQWDGYVFNSTLDNGETGYLSKAKYTDLSAGLNFAIFPTDMVYLKMGVAVAHLNQPRESFYSQQNVLGMRPTGYIDLMARVGGRVVLNPSAYYTRQRDASQLMFGTLATIFIGDASDGNLILGVYDRWNDAIIMAFGYEWRGLRAMASYDYTTSALGPYVNRKGALEFGIRYQGDYKDNSMRNLRRAYTCPRF